MIFQVGINTYMTVAEADQIVEDEFDDGAEKELYESLDEISKQRLILTGTRKISTIIWRGRQYPGFQSMQWPRLITYRYVDCPYDVKIAILKQALKDKIYSASKEASLIDAGISQYKIKDASISFSENAEKANRLDNGIWEEVYRDYLDKWTA